MDHVHLSVAIPPKFSLPNFMGELKGKSTLRFMTGIRNCRANGIRHFWRGDIT